MPVFDVDTIIAETNQQLHRKHQINPDDAIVTSIILHKRILELQVDAIQKKLDESLHMLTTVSEEQSSRADAIAERVMLTSGNSIEKQLDVAAERWEQRLKNAAEAADANIRATTRLAWVCGGLIGLTTSLMLGFSLAISQVVFDLIHHTRISPHNTADCNLSTPRTQTKLARKRLTGSS
jgi:hypothetical protein